MLLVNKLQSTLYKTLFFIMYISSTHSRKNEINPLAIYLPFTSFLETKPHVNTDDNPPQKHFQVGVGLCLEVTSGPGSFALQHV